MELLAWFENTGLSTWVRESPPVFPTILVIHAIGMGTLVGANVVVGLRAIGIARSIELSTLARFAPLVWIGFIACLVSGLLLLAGYPAKALTNPVFYLKFAFIGAAFALWRRMRRTMDSGEVVGTLPLAGVGLLLLWAGVITAGRFLAYTHTVLLASHLVP
jgi:hypothetical protein